MPTASCSSSAAWASPSSWRRGSPSGTVGSPPAVEGASADARASSLPITPAALGARAACSTAWGGRGGGRAPGAGHRRGRRRRGVRRGHLRGQHGPARGLPRAPGLDVGRRGRQLLRAGGRGPRRRWPWRPTRTSAASRPTSRRPSPSTARPSPSPSSNPTASSGSRWSSRVGPRSATTRSPWAEGRWRRSTRRSATPS